MDEYMFLKPKRAREIRLSRVRDLEEDHFGALLLLEENPDDQTAASMVAELRRRIEHHHIALNVPQIPPQQDDLPGHAEETTPGESG